MTQLQPDLDLAALINNPWNTNSWNPWSGPWSSAYQPHQPAAPDAMPTFAGGEPSPKSSGFEWGDLALPFLGGMVGLTLGMRRPELTQQLYQLGSLGSLLQMRQQYGEQREEALQLRHQDMVERGARENAEKGLPNAVLAGVRAGVDQNFISPAQAQIILHNTLPRAVQIFGNNQLLDQLAGETGLWTPPSVAAGELSMKSPAQPPAGGGAAPGAKRGLFLPGVFPRVPFQETEVVKQIGTGTARFKVDVAGLIMDRYMDVQYKLAAQAGQELSAGDLYNRMKMSNNPPAVLERIEKLHENLFNITWNEEYQRTGNIAQAAVNAVKKTHWMPTSSHEAHQYVSRSSKELGKLELTRVLTQQIIPLSESILAGQEVTNTIDLNSLRSLLDEKSHFAVTSEDVRDVVRGFSPFVEQAYNYYKLPVNEGGKGLSRMAAANRAQAVYGGFIPPPENSEMAEILKPSRTATEAFLKTAGTPTEAVQQEAAAVAQSKIRIPPEDGRAYARLQHFINVGRELNRTLDAVATHYGGPMSIWGTLGLMKNALEMGNFPKKYHQFRADLLNWTANLTHELAGANVGPREAEYREQFPNIKTNNTLDFQARLARTLFNLEDIQKERVEAWEMLNYDTSGLRRISPNLPEPPPSQVPSISQKAPPPPPPARFQRVFRDTPLIDESTLYRRSGLETP